LLDRRAGLCRSSQQQREQRQQHEWRDRRVQAQRQHA